MTATATAPATINPAAVQDALAAKLRVVLANSVTGVYGLSGSGKSSILDTAIEYAFDNFGAQSLVYTADLGGYGTRRLALVRKRIAFCWDPRNHLNPMETMEAASKGAFPAYLLPGGPATQDERDRGWAPPDCELVYPIRERWTRVCASGHVEGHYYEAAQLAAAVQLRGVACPTCQGMLNVQHARVKHPAFKNIGHRGYDSMTAMNEWGFSDLGQMSAKGLLPKVGEKGSTLLGGADALVQGTMRWSGGSQQQVGFMQNRSHDWIANIKAIEGHVIPPTMTFLVEMSKGDDESGGMRVLGPKIQGNARTSSVPGWLGNCLHAVREPQQPGNAASPMVYRLWLKMHVDPLDARNVPYLAKTRGTPVGLPDYLEDELDPAKAWHRVNLGHLYNLLADQVAGEEARLEEKYAAKLAALQAVATEEEVVTLVAGASAQSPSAAMATAAAAAGGPAPVPAAAPARPARRIAGAAPAVAVAPVPVTAAPAPPTPVGVLLVGPTTIETPAVNTAGSPAAAPGAQGTGSTPAPPPPVAVAGGGAPPPAPVAPARSASGRRPPVAPPPVVAAPQAPAAAQTPPPAPAAAALPQPPPPSPPAAPAATAGARPGAAPRRVPRPPVG